MCASPDYLTRRGEPASPEALADHDCIAFEGLQSYRSWTFGRGADARTIAIRPRFSVNTAAAVVDGAAAGLGIARVLSYQAAGAIERGVVRPILRDWPDASIPVSVVHRSQHAQPLKRRAFLDFAVPRLSLVLQQIEAVVVDR